MIQKKSKLYVVLVFNYFNILKKNEIHELLSIDKKNLEKFIKKIRKIKLFNI